MQVPRRVVRFNNAINNPIQSQYAWLLPPWAIVAHRGRRSGRLYRTPVIAFRRGSSLAIGVLYGDGSDWVQNVLAGEAPERSCAAAGLMSSSIRASPTSTGRPSCRLRHGRTGASPDACCSPSSAPGGPALGADRCPPGAESPFGPLRRVHAGGVQRGVMRAPRKRWLSVITLRTYAVEWLYVYSARRQCWGAPEAFR